jgi:putative transposase
LREIINAIQDRYRTGCQWHYLPHDLPVWETVLTIFLSFQIEGVWKQVNDTLRVKVRKKAKRHEEPSAGCMDSQSVKTAGQAKKDTCGYDAAKHVYGKKRHILVETQGLLLEIVITPANVQDRDGAKLLLNKIEGHYPFESKKFLLTVPMRVRLKVGHRIFALEL